MKINRFTLAVVSGAAFVVFLPFFIFIVRSPVLIVSDPVFEQLYGVSRVRRETVIVSLSLYRRVITVAVADDTGDDIVQFAISQASSKPYCVIIPLRFAKAARLYREKNPLIPVVLLEGRAAQGTNPVEFGIGDNKEDYFLYRTDIDADFYRAGIAAAFLDGDKNGSIAVFLDAPIQTQAREAFFRALNDVNKPLQSSFYTNYSQSFEIQELSCLVLAGVGAEYIDKQATVPIIFFSWIDITYMPNDIIIVFDDSPWAQLHEAVRMVSAKMTEGQIPSKCVVLGAKNIDKRILRKIKKIR